MADFRSLLDDTNSVIAVVGAGDDPNKYGAVIYRDLKRKGYRVRAVNPNRESVDGDPSYPTLGDLPEPPDIVDFVVPPSVGLRVARQAVELGYTNIWLQPGAESPSLLAYLQSQDVDYLADACIMVHSRMASRRD